MHGSNIAFGDAETGTGAPRVPAPALYVYHCRTRVIKCAAGVPIEASPPSATNQPKHLLGHLQQPLCTFGMHVSTSTTPYACGCPRPSHEPLLQAPQSMYLPLFDWLLEATVPTSLLAIAIESFGVKAALRQLRQTRTVLVCSHRSSDQAFVSIAEIIIGVWVFHTAYRVPATGWCSPRGCLDY
jgi:hypothetical protein